jgi:hypothetical protein
MRTLTVAVLVVTGAALLAAPGQQTTSRPGQMTEARVWIENHGRSEAVPVDLRDVNLERPLKVEVMNGDPSVSRPVGIVRGRQLWEYKEITVSPNFNPTQVLNTEGLGGWELTGVVLTIQDRTTILLKRPR